MKKALIPVAGLGTRFLPATKTVPKEMLPIVDRPILLHVIEEVVASGIEDIILISGRGKNAIEDLFDVSYELEDQLVKSGKESLLSEILYLRGRVNLISVRQHHALGLGHAVYCGKSVIGKEPFAVLLGDEIMCPRSGQQYPVQELKEVFSQHGKSAVAIMEVPPQDVCKYGIVAGKPEGDGPFKITGVIEKPAMAEAPSNLALPGRYVFTADIFDLLRDTTPGKNGEIQLSDAMNRLAKKDGLLGKKFSAERFDAGDKLGFLKANVEFGLKHQETKVAFREYLHQLMKNI